MPDVRAGVPPAIDWVSRRPLGEKPLRVYIPLLRLELMENKQVNEQAVMRELIQSLAGEPLTFTLDALHCQKNCPLLT